MAEDDNGAIQTNLPREGVLKFWLHDTKGPFLGCSLQPISTQMVGTPEAELQNMTLAVK